MDILSYILGKKYADKLVGEHKADNMPHQINDITNDKKYRYGLQIKDGVTQLIYEEVV